MLKSEKKKNLTIVGGGITGLAAAYIAVINNWNVTILEAESDVGGLMRTFKIGGNRLECFYHHFFSHDKELTWLIKSLNLEKNLTFKKTTMGIFRDKKIYDFSTPLDLMKFKSIDIFDKLRFALSTLYLGKLSSWRKMESVSAMEWFYKYAGRGATEAIWKPMLDIKFGTYSNEVPVSWMIGRLSQRMNSRDGTEESLGYIRGSMQTLTDEIKRELEKNNVKIITNAEVIDLRIEHNELKEIITSKNNFNNCHFLFTIPTSNIAKLVRKNNMPYADKLSEIEYFKALCLILVLKNKLSNIYWLNIADEGYPFGGIIEHTNFINPGEYNGLHISYLSRYYSKKEALSNMNNSEIEEIMMKGIKRIYPDFKLSDVLDLYMYKTDTAATLCDLNFSGKVPKCKTPIGNMYIASMPHVYPDERSCNNSIRVAAEACRVMGMDSSFVPYGSSLSGKIGF
ncbi:FAD-dependent oxidoreductase [Spirochaetota bacterium]